MKKIFYLLLLSILLLIQGNYVHAESGSRFHNKEIINSITANFKKNAKISLKNYEINSKWIQAEFDIYDKETYPLTINILTNVFSHPKKIIYMVAPSGFNFKFNYFSNGNNNIAHFMREKGYLVIGISFRESNLPADASNDFVKDWGLEKHRNDVRFIVKLIKNIVKLPYDMLGHANSAVCILDYAGKYSDNLEKIILLDTDSFDPAIQPQKVQYANITFNALNQIMDQGMYLDPFVADFSGLTQNAVMYPDFDSGQSRSALGLPGNFTLNGFAHFALIYTTLLPGIHTPITGLPGEWVMNQGIAAGYYNFAPDPFEDSFRLTNSDLSAVSQATQVNGSGLTPIAINRDIYAIQALNGAYKINWKGIKEKVIMVNAEFSSGNQTYYATLIKNAGNRNVSITLIPNYAYLDLLFGKNADKDVWSYFVNEE